MSGFGRFQIVERSPSFLLKETSFFDPFFQNDLYYSLDLLGFTTPAPSLFFDDLDTVTDLIQIHETPFRTTTRRLTRRVDLGDLYLQTLSDRVSALELGVERLVSEEKCRKKKFGDRKYTWTAEIKTPEKERKYKLLAEIKDGNKGLNKSYKWTTEIKRKGHANLPIEQTYTIKVSTGDKSGESDEKQKTKSQKSKLKNKSVGGAPRIVEIEEPSDNGGIILRQVFTKTVDKKRGKRKELSPDDAAALIQTSFRYYLIRRSQALRALRELANAKNKLKEIRALFNNFSYRRRLSRDAQECQKFSEKIIVLLLTVDAIEGADLMVRAAKKSMVDELEAMLDVVDPQPGSKSLSIKRRTFDMPDAVVNKELAAGVAQVVRMLDEEATSSETS